MTCKEGYERILTREIKTCALNLSTKGKGWVLVKSEGEVLSKPQQACLFELCFAYHILENPVHLSAASVNGFAEALADLFITDIGQQRIAALWAYSFFSSGNEQLIHRTKTVQKCWLEKISKKMSRVAKLAQEGIPYSAGFAEGFFVHFIDFDQAFVSFNAFSQGQQRMQMDVHAPSRSYLKLEEAFHVFGHEPQKDETVIDLGASPGGWSYSALKRGAIVTAIDHGPLKEPVRSSQNITHLAADALTYKHNFHEPADWLLCDILESPDIILNLLHHWFSRKWCHHFIVNFKVGREDPLALLREIRSRRGGLLQYCRSLCIRQLYHDREEITLMGEVKK